MTNVRTTISNILNKPVIGKVTFLDTGILSVLFVSLVIAVNMLSYATAWMFAG
jgi:hypothetical protein